MDFEEPSIEGHELKKYYVYELINSITNEVFYVGKGQSYRVNQHELDAKNVLYDSPKIDMIREITQQGGEVIKLIIGRFNEENEALAVESTLIHWIYGIQNLTNIAGGHGCDTIRPKGDCCIIEGIDIPPKERSNNGEYTSLETRKIIENDIENFMRSVKGELEQKLNIIFSDVKIDKSRFTEIYHEISDVKIAIFSNNSTTKKLKLEIRPITSRKEHVRKIIELCSKQAAIESRSNGMYALIPSQKPTQDIDEICKHFNQAREIILSTLIPRRYD